MADKDFNFEEFLSDTKKSQQGKHHATRNTSNTGTTRTTSHTSLHPFSVRLDKPYIDKIKAIAWYKQISQREVIELAVDNLMEDLNPQEIEKTISEFVYKHFS